MRGKDFYDLTIFLPLIPNDMSGKSQKQHKFKPNSLIYSPHIKPYIIKEQLMHQPRFSTFLIIKEPSNMQCFSLIFT